MRKTAAFVTRFVSWAVPVALAAGCPAPAQSPGPQQPAPVESEAPAGAVDGLRHPDEAHLADIVQLTNGGENAEAYWSFDGTQLIFQTKRPPYQCDQIMRMPADGSGEPVLVSTGKGATTCSYFLPGDQEIVYSSTHDRSPECPPPPDYSKGYVWRLNDFDVYRANADGGNLRKLTDRVGYDAEATVCPVDGSILFTSDRDGDLELYRMKADGTDVVRLTNTPGYDGGAFFNADCTQIVWRASRPQGAELDEFRALLKQKMVRPSKLEIFVADADGSNARQITYLGAAAFAPYFHPSGKRVLFSTNYKDPRGREFDIWAVNTDGTGLEQITFSEGFDGFPMFSPDGTRLAFASNRHNAKEGETNVFVARWVEDPVRHTHTPADRFKANVRWLADDAREGRGVGTAGLDASADWLEAQLRELGVDGGMPDGGYRQPLDVTVALDRGAATALAIDGAAVSAEEFVPASMSASGGASGQTVFAGYGISSSQLGIDDYRGVNVRGKVAVVRRFVPDTPKFKDERVKRRYSDLAYKAFTARERGAVALVVVDVPVVRKGDAIPDAPLPELAPTGDNDAGIPIVVVTRARGSRLVKGRHQVAINVALERKQATVYNIVGKIVPERTGVQPGVLVIGAHYDHLGWGGRGSLEHGQRVIHNGADDNASGTAALLEVARSLREVVGTGLARPVYIVFFTAEESGVIGSTHFVKHLPTGVTAADVVAMLNMDMVGRLRNNTVSVLGGESASEWSGIVTAACERANVRCTIGGDGYGASDHMPFYAAGVPVLQFFSDSHTDYHKATDDADRINAIGGVRVAQIVTDVARAVAARAENLTLVRVQMAPRGGDVRARGGSLGTIPAYAPSEDPGVVISGVRPGGPADKAGLKADDRIVKLGATEIRSIRDLMFVLGEATPGQTTTVEVVRDGAVVRKKIQFGPPSRRMSR